MRRWVRARVLKALWPLQGEGKREKARSGVEQRNEGPRKSRKGLCQARDCDLQNMFKSDPLRPLSSSLSSLLFFLLLSLPSSHIIFLLALSPATFILCELSSSHPLTLVITVLAQSASRPPLRQQRYGAVMRRDRHASFSFPTVFPCLETSNSFGAKWRP